MRTVTTPQPQQPQNPQQKRIGTHGQMALPPQHMQMSQQFQSSQNSHQQSVNQFNKRLVHEIQQNHPMLPFSRINNLSNGKFFLLHFYSVQ